jgi:hypothetical protein
MPGMPGGIYAPSRVPNFGKSVQKAWDKGTFFKKSHTIQHHYNQQVVKRGLDMSVKQYTKEAQNFFQKFSKSPQYTKKVPLKSGEGTALRITVGDKMGPTRDVHKYINNCRESTNVNGLERVAISSLSLDQRI